MTNEPSLTPQLQPTTTRVGGGRRAWLVALAALVVLGTFIYLGTRGGTSVLKPQATPSMPTVAVVPTLVAQPPALPPDPNEIVSIRADPTAPVLYQYLGTALTINGQGTLAILDPVGPLAYRGLYRIPVSQTASTATLEFDAVTASVSHDDLERLGRWDFAINSIAHGTGSPVVVLDTNERADNTALTNPDFNLLLTNGYRLTVTTQNQGDAAMMTIDVTVNPELSFPDETYSMVAGPNDYGFALEKFGLGGYDASIPIPTSLFGQTVSLALIASNNSGPATATTNIGTWSLDIVKRLRPKDFGRAAPLEVHVDGRPITDSDPGVLQSGYDLVVRQVVSGGQLNLAVVLNVRPLPAPSSPEPTR